MSFTIIFEKGPIKEIKIDIAEISKRIPYFKNLYYGQYQESNHDTITLSLDDPEIIIDIIQDTPYGSNWEYIHKRLIYENYFGMIPNLKILDGIIIKPEYFEELIDYFGYSTHIIKAISNNLPHNYKPSPELTEHLKRMMMGDEIFIHTCHDIEIWDLGKLIISVSRNNINEKIKEYHPSFKGIPYNLVYLCDGEILFSCKDNHNEKLCVFNLAEMKIISLIESPIYFTTILANDHLIIGSGYNYDSGRTSIWNRNGLLLHETEIHYKSIILSHCNNFLAMCNAEYLDIYCAYHPKLFKRFELTELYICGDVDLSYTDDDTKIIIKGEQWELKHDIYIISAENGEILHRYDYGKYIWNFNVAEDVIMFAGEDGLNIIESEIKNLGGKYKYVSFLAKDKLIYLDNDNRYGIYHIDEDRHQVIKEYKEGTSILHRKIIHPRCNITWDY